MNKIFKEFKLPRYSELPDVGLYLDQTVKYINDILEPLNLSITPSMLSNYVKKGYIERPDKKQYTVSHIAYLVFLIVAKQVLSIDNIATLFELQRATYSLPTAYDYFCQELEDMLAYIFEIKKEPPAITNDVPYAKKALRSVVIAVSHIIYLNYCFDSHDLSS